LAFATLSRPPGFAIWRMAAIKLLALVPNRCMLVSETPSENELERKASA